MSISHCSRSIRDQLFTKITTPHFKAKDLGQIWREIYENAIWWLVPFLITLGIFTAVISVGCFFAAFAFPIEEIYKYGTYFLAFLGATAFLHFLKKGFSFDKFVFQRYDRVTHLKEPMTAIEEFEILLLEQVVDFKKRKPDVQRVVVFVDDLDRLPADEMINGIEAVRSFMEISEEKLPQGIGMVFVISCDEEKITEALTKRSQSGIIVSKDDAKRYLDRLFQFRLEIPPFPRLDMRNYIIEKFKLPELSPVLKTIESKDVKIEAIVDRMIHVSVQSPRNALQILNAFLQTWWLANKREREGEGSSKPGGLTLGSITNHPLVLAVLSTIKVDFPQFYNDLIEVNNLIELFTEFFINESIQFEDLAYKSKLILGKYWEKTEAEDKTTIYSLKDNYSPLRQYIASLRGVKWPPSLQAFLELSQDPIARKLGDKQIAIFHALVSGDHKGVLAGFGRQVDEKPLTNENMRVLQMILDDMIHDTETRQDLASQAVASLAERFPPGDVTYFIKPLANRIATSNTLRSMIGVDAIDAVIKRADPSEQKDVARSLIVDFLQSDRPINFKIGPKQDTPTVEQGKNLVLQVTDLVLDIRNSIGSLGEQEDKDLSEWLLSRTYSIDGKEKIILPFEILESWFNKFEENLVPLLGDKYSDLFLSELTTHPEISQSIELDKTISRLKAIYNNIIKSSGQETLEELRSHLTEIAQVKSEQIVNFTWEYIYSNRDKFDDGAKSELISAMLERLMRAVSEPEIWGLKPWKSYFEMVTRIVSLEVSSIDGQSWSKVMKVINVLYNEATNRNEDYLFDDALVLFNIAYPQIGVEHLQEVIPQWISLWPENLNINFCGWIATHFYDLEVKFKEALFNQLVRKLKQPLSENASKVVEEFINKLDLVEQRFLVNSGLLTASFHNVIDQYRSNNGNQAIVNQNFGVFAPLLKLTDDATVLEDLRYIFMQNVQVPAVYENLHNYMKDNWPTSEAAKALYTPQEVFNQYYEASKTSGNVNNSLASLVKMRLAHDGNPKKIIESAVQLWKISQKSSAYTLFLFENPLDGQQLGTILNTTNLSSDLELLFKVIQHQAQLSDESNALNSMKTILASNAHTAKYKDVDILDKFIDSYSHQKELLNNLVVDEEISDESRKMIWQKIVKRITGYDYAELFGLMAEISKLEIEVVRNTLEEMFDDLPDLIKFDPYASDQSVILKGLIDLIESDHVFIMNSVLEWLKTNNVRWQSVKKYFSKFEFSEDDLEIIRQYYPRAL